MSPMAPGRPRSEAVDDAILAAAVRCLASSGYDALSLSAVARAAGVGRPAIYRRYDSKAQLVAAALLHLSDRHQPDVPRDPHDAIRVLLGATAAALASPGSMTILGSMLAREQQDPILIATFREAVFEPRHAIVREVITAAMANGRVQADIDPDVIIDLLFGSLLARALSGRDMDAEYLDRVVQIVWTTMRPAGS